MAHFAPFANTLAGTSVTVKVDGAAALTDFKFGQVTGYLNLAPGNHQVQVFPSGSMTAAISGTVNLAADTSYTLSAIGNVSKQPLELFPLVDDTTAPASGAKVRIAHLAPFSNVINDTKVDICTAAGAVVVPNVPYKGFTMPYLSLAAGDYQLKIAAPGGTCSTTLLSLPSIRLSNGDIADVFAIGDIVNQPLAYASATGLTLTPPARVKVAHFAPFANTLAGTSVTVKVDGAAALTDFKFGQITGYLNLAPGSHQVQVFPTGSMTAAISGTVMLDGGKFYNLAAIGDGTKQPLQLFSLPVTTTFSSTNALLRVAHLAPFDANLDNTKVDICTAAGMVVDNLQNVPYKVFSGYLSLAPGVYNLKVTAAGSNCATTLITLPALKLNSGDVVTAFAIGDVTNFAPQVTTTLDNFKTFMPAINK